MAENNIFDIIKKERINISEIDTYNINKFFLRYYYKYMLLIKKKLTEQNEVIFENEVEAIGNMFFHISWIILLTTFNIHITLFFMERAALLFSEYIIISSNEEKYKIESNTKLNDAIIFTYKKTVGETILEKILKENEHLKNNSIYKSLLNVRTCNYLDIKMINEILKTKSYKQIERNMKILKNIFENVYNIYQIIDIDTHLYSKLLNIFSNNNTSKSLFMIKIYCEIVDIYLSDLFFNNIEKEIEFFLEILDKIFVDFEKNNKFDNISYNISDIYNNKLFKEFKESVFKFIEE
jgi:hypothetical protein